MYAPLKPFNALLIILSAVAATSSLKFVHFEKQPTPPIIAKEVSIVSAEKPSRKIQVAVLLDVSNSMDGLIEQAKSQLWNMVNVLGKATCDGQNPEIQIALYEYGRSTNNVNAGYVKQISAFSTDLDQVSKNLFSLTTNGGDEFCGQVMYSSVKDLHWDTSANNYKVIFIAGNEDFLQGRLSFTKACSAAKEKGIIVNTIYCGDRVQGIREHWNLGAECGQGSFTFINADARPEEIATPYDDQVFQLNEQLNKTYIYYGKDGVENKEKQEEMDRANYTVSKAAAAKRVAVKGKKSLYKNDSWDLVDAQEADSDVVAKIETSSLPASLKGKSKEEIKTYVKKQSAERTKIQQQIEIIQHKREAFILAERKKSGTASNQATLETEVEKIIRQQAGRYKIIIQ